MANKKKNKLLQLVAADCITPEDFKEMTAACNQEIKDAEDEIHELEQSMASAEEFRKHIEHIRKVLAEAQQDVTKGTISKEFIDTYIKRIFVTPEGEDTARLDIQIFTGERCEAFLQTLRRDAHSCSRMGHTFKKMIESYERNMK